VDQLSHPESDSPLFDRERDAERLRQVEALLARVEAELAELDVEPAADDGPERA
jgi:hypothetical protein